jgi:hypothetical protein
LLSTPAPAPAAAAPAGIAAPADWAKQSNDDERMKKQLQLGLEQDALGAEPEQHAAVHGPSDWAQALTAPVFAWHLSEASEGQAPGLHADAAFSLPSAQEGLAALDLRDLLQGDVHGVITDYLHASPGASGHTSEVGITSSAGVAAPWSALPNLSEAVHSSTSDAALVYRLMQDNRHTID